MGLGPVAVAVLVVLGSASSAVAASATSTGGLFPSRSWQGGAPSSAHLLSPHAAGLRVVASGLNQPHGLTVGPDGSLYVAEVGDAVAGAGCTTGAEAACANTSGSIDRITPQGAVSTVVPQLPQVSNPGGGSASGGVSGVRVVNGKIYAVIQNMNIDRSPANRPTGRRERSWATW